MTRMPRPDADTADRLLTGRLAPDDAPPGYSRVAALLSSAAAPDQGSADPSQLRELVDAVRTSRPASDSRRHHMLGKVLTMKAAVAAGVLTLGVATAGAVTGTLPTPVQNGAHDLFAHAGVTIPNGDEVTTNDDGPTPADVVSNVDDNSQDDTGVAPVSPPPAPTDQSGDHQGDEPGDQVTTPAPQHAANPPAEVGDDNSQGDNQQGDDNSQGDDDQGDHVSTPPPSDHGTPPPSDQGGQDDQGGQGNQDQQGDNQN
jgi:hypothetical protein